MKKNILRIFYLTLFIFLTLYFYINTNELKKNNKKIYQFFSEKEILDSKGNINITEISSKRDKIKEKIMNDFSVSKIELSELTKKKEELKVANEQKIQDINSLNSELKELTQKEESLKKQYNNLNNKYNELKRNQKAGTTYLIKNFPTINQYPNYPTGCESVALTMLLKYNNINVSVNNVIDNLKKGSIPYNENGVMYGGNPEIEFVGNPYTKAGYGAYEKPLAEVANKYKNNINIKNNFDFNNVLELVKNNTPVMVWTSMYLAVPYISTNWIYKPTSERIYWKANEHAVVVIGYNNENIIISDPLGGQVKYQSRNIFVSRYNYYGKRALYY